MGIPMQIYQGQDRELFYDWRRRSVFDERVTRYCYYTGNNDYPPLPDAVKEQIQRSLNGLGENDLDVENLTEDEDEDGDGEGVEVEDIIRSNWGLEFVRINNYFSTHDLQSFESFRNFNNKYWLFYSNEPDDKKLLLYDFNDQHFTVIKEQFHGQLNLLLSNTITSMDCNFDFDSNTIQILVGFKNGKLVKLCCDLNGNVNNHLLLRDSTTSSSRNERYQSILNVWAGLLPHFVVSFSVKNGLLITSLYHQQSDGNFQNFKTNLDLPRNLDTATNVKSVLNFPQFTLYKGDDMVFHCKNFLEPNDSILNEEISFMLKLDEAVQKIDYLLKTDHVLLETNVRYLSIPIRNLAENLSSTVPHTDSNVVYPIFYKTQELHVHASRSGRQIANNGKYIFITEQHLYGTALSVYKYSTPFKRWIFVGYSDIRAKYGIKSVKDLFVGNCPSVNSPVVTILTDDNNIQTILLK
ncbi:YPL201C [Saccharomyces arboricola H-6]|uniref:YPL201C n=1 Tax=Saccharomyces arboricola (strain H-6 / AS 2.3317 / CBS 10644) TaxID=1160507 RepID=J8Q1D7_SACAR|nr:YPL201C [Saccharomyces arboricola H-6]